MKDVLKLTAKEILVISITSPEKLFTGDTSIAKQEWHNLTKVWHPDRASGNAEVMTHINALYDLAINKLKLGIWSDDGIARITSKITNKVYEIKFLRKHDFELGEMYVGNNSIVFAIAEDGYDLADLGLERIKNLKYANPTMKEEFSRYLPTIKYEDQTEDRRIIVMQKTPDVLLLRDVLDHYNDKIDPKHVAWILSRLYNIGCFLKFNDISLNDISPDTCFISPEFHTVSIIGGWWYSTLLGRSIRAVPSRTILYAPLNLIDKKVGDSTIDSELIKATGRELLGDITGAGKFNSDSTIPKALKNWLQSPGSSDLYEEYQKWTNVLLDSFGKRKFVEMKLEAKDIYI